MKPFDSLRSRWFGSRPLDGRGYFDVGMKLLAVKLAMDWVVSLLFKIPWSPWSYLFWPIASARGVPIELAEPHAAVILWLSVPFAFLGTMLTWRRLRDADLPLWWVVFFFVPVLNLLFFAILCLHGTQSSTNVDSEDAALRILESRGRRVSPAVEQRLASPPLDRRRATQALLFSIPLIVLLTAFGVHVLTTYGFGVFLGAPFVLGFLIALLLNVDGTQTLRHCTSTALTGVTLVGLCFLLLAFEGLICLLMAAPIAYPLAWLGACVGYAVSRGGKSAHHGRSMTWAVIALLPGLMAAEYAAQPIPPLWEVRTTVEIDAPPEIVWQHVVSFPPLREPNDWLFGTGIAYPQRAEITGSGVGAVRHCVFSTGAFVEPIDVWDPPRRLRFRVTEQPPPMREWSPFDIHPPHLDHYLVSRAGEFRLSSPAPGRTLLEGSTWYENRMWPAAYWRVWSDFIIGRIHRRVLEHIRGLAETEVARRG